MSEEVKSYRQILRSTSIIGGASLINILIGLIRTKVAAIFLGPTGIGLIGIFNNLINTASNLASLGFGPAGTRQIAESAGRRNDIEISLARQSLFWGTLILGIGAGIVFWLTREVISTHILKDSSLTDDVGWLAVGVALNIAAISQSAVLNGMRRIGDLARISLVSALLSTALGIPALLFWGQSGLLAYLLMTPISSYLVAHYYISKLPKSISIPTSLPFLFKQWHDLARLGIAFMLGGLAVTVGNLAVRAIVQREIGTAALGHFEAAWMISMTYMGLILRAMGADYYPRLTEIINTHEAANKLVNEQTEVALLLSGPLILTALGLTPWIVSLLYSSQFTETVDILRWQIIGDILKIASWPLGVLILAAGDGRSYLFAETLAVLVFVLFVWIGIPYLGLIITGIAFLSMYAFYLPIVYWIANRRSSFSYDRIVSRKFFVLLISSIGVVLASKQNSIFGAILGISTALLYGVLAIVRLKHMANISKPFVGLNHAYQKIATKLGFN